MRIGNATLAYHGQTLDLPVLEGSAGERAVDIAELRAKTGLVTLDPSFANTGSTTSAITFIDGDQGILRYRGYDIKEVAEHASFLETAHLLIYGELPDAAGREAFERQITQHVFLHEDIRRVIDAFPSSAHPMAMLSACACSLSSFYTDALNVNRKDRMALTIIRLLAKFPTLTAFIYRKQRGLPYVYPSRAADYCGNFLSMMFGEPDNETLRRNYIDAGAGGLEREQVRALNLMLILHADHEQNCSTSTVRLVGSAETNLFASVAAGICALWGPLHGGANEAVVNMLTEIHESGKSVDDYVKLVKDKSSGKKLMGFGHRVYKNFDPRAGIIKAQCDRLLDRMKRSDPLLDIARRLEETALKDPYFVERKLYPNVDFYSGVIYRAMGIPENMFTAMFALGRLPGWIAHWKEMLETPGRRIGRPRQIYTGPAPRPFPAAKPRG